MAYKNLYPLRPRKYVLEFESWQIKEIRLALKEADAGNFVSDEDLAKAIKGYAR